MSDEEDDPVASRELWRAQTAYPVHIDEIEGTYTASDLSAGGLFAAGAPQLPVGSKVHVEVDLPDGKLRCDGEVRWVRARRVSPAVREGMGIAFSPLGDVDRERVRALVEELKP